MGKLAKWHGWLLHSYLNHLNATSYTDRTDYKGERERFQEISCQRSGRALIRQWVRGTKWTVGFVAIKKNLSPVFFVACVDKMLCYVLNPEWEKIVCSDDKALQSIADGTINTPPWLQEPPWWAATREGVSVNVCLCVCGGFSVEEHGLQCCLFLSWTLCGLLQYHCLGPLLSLTLLLMIVCCLPWYLSELHAGHHNGEAKEATYLYTGFPLWWTSSLLCHFVSLKTAPWSRKKITIFQI